MSYASAAALPSGLTLSSTDFTEPVSKGTVKLRVSGGTGSYTWISEDPSIATVASDGTVTLVAKGTTHVVVTDGSKRAICIVRVTGGSAPASGGTTSGTTAPTTSPSTGGSLKAGNAVVVNGGNGVRVRSGPGTDHEILATIPNGGSVRVISSAGNDWYEITFTAVGGVTTTGYMKGEFLANS
ncbi:MAG: SH3 domain-containing protein [Oscillibacter sp.]|nr:SH3 domain-containing protein [Oscillibacter sp.]